MVTHIVTQCGFSKRLTFRLSRKEFRFPVFGMFPFCKEHAKVRSFPRRLQTKGKSRSPHTCSKMSWGMNRFRVQICFRADHFLTCFPQKERRLDDRHASFQFHLVGAVVLLSPCSCRWLVMSCAIFAAASSPGHVVQKILCLSN